MAKYANIAHHMRDIGKEHPDWQFASVVEAAKARCTDSMTTPTSAAKLSRDAHTARQQDAQRRFAFGYN